MIICALISVLMFLIAILLYLLDKRQLVSCKLAMAAVYLSIAYSMGLGSIPTRYIMDSFVILSNLLLLIAVIILNYVAYQKGVFKDYHQKDNQRVLVTLGVAYIIILMVDITYTPYLKSLTTISSLKPLMGSMVVYLVWNLLSYFLHIILFPKHIIRDFPAYIVITDLYDCEGSLRVAKGLYELYQKTAIIMVANKVNSNLSTVTKSEFDSVTAIVDIKYDGVNKDLVLAIKEKLYELEIIDEGVIVASEAEYLKLGLLAKKAGLDTDIAIILDEEPDYKLHKVYDQLRQIVNCFKYEYLFHFLVLGIFIILNVFL